jgi:DNA ligase D-like protein (predicted 3'-phosphoesterase)
MNLEEYQKKRDFNISSEPKGDIGDEQGNMFVIQEHHASHLHWDLRLEIGGVLKSWAVPKDPADVNYGTKRLAIQVEDHPIEYASFEGTIPEGEYGAGTVKIWDNGKFILEEETDNKLTFQLKGKKMVGIYTLVKTPNMGKNSWLLLKKK